MPQPYAPQASLIGFGQFAPEPSQVLASTCTPAWQLAARQGSPPVRKASLGHSASLPLQVSATSHAPAEGRHSVALPSTLHVPTASPALHVWQSAEPPPQGVSQHTPSTQLPELHSGPLVHPAPFGPSSSSTGASCGAAASTSPASPAQLTDASDIQIAYVRITKRRSNCTFGSPGPWDVRPAAIPTVPASFCASPV